MSAKEFLSKILSSLGIIFLFTLGGGVLAEGIRFFTQLAQNSTGVTYAVSMFLIAYFILIILVGFIVMIPFLVSYFITKEKPNDQHQNHA